MLNLGYFVGKKIQQIRNQFGLTQEELAEKANLDNRTISSVERGERNLSLTSLERVASALNVTPDTLLQLPKKDKEEDVEKNLIIQEFSYLLKDKDIKYHKFILEITKLFLRTIET